MSRSASHAPRLRRSPAEPAASPPRGGKDARRRQRRERMSPDPTKARTPRQAQRRRAKAAARGKRRAGAPPAPGEAGLVAAPAERFPAERRREVVAALWRLAEEQMRAL